MNSRPDPSFAETAASGESSPSTTASSVSVRPSGLKGPACPGVVTGDVSGDPGADGAGDPEAGAEAGPDPTVPVGPAVCCAEPHPATIAAASTTHAARRMGIIGFIVRRSARTG